MEFLHNSWQEALVTANKHCKRAERYKELNFYLTHKLEAKSDDVKVRKRKDDLSPTRDMLRLQLCDSEARVRELAEELAESEAGRQTKKKQQREHIRAQKELETEVEELRLWKAEAEIHLQHMDRDRRQFPMTNEALKQAASRKRSASTGPRATPTKPSQRCEVVIPDVGFNRGKQKRHGAGSRLRSSSAPRVVENGAFRQGGFAYPTSPATVCRQNTDVLRRRAFR